LKVPSRFHCPPPACWLTATGVAPAEWVTV
jgi:hypothetical protein